MQEWIARRTINGNMHVNQQIAIIKMHRGRFSVLTTVLAAMHIEPSPVFLFKILHNNN